MSGLKASGLKTKQWGEFDLHWQGMLADYVTAIAWSPDGKTLAAISAAGEVVLYQAGAWQKYLYRRVAETRLTASPSPITDKFWR